MPAIIPENSAADSEAPSPDKPVTLDPTRLALETPDNNTTPEVDPVPEQTVGRSIQGRRNREGQGGEGPPTFQITRKVPFFLRQNALLDFVKIFY